MLIRLNRILITGIVGLYAADFAGAADPAAAVSLLQQKCGACHGETSGMSGFRVTSRESVLKGGNRGPAVVAGKSAESLMYRAVAHTAEFQMPPTGALKTEEVQLLREWIDGGAQWSTGVATSSS